MIEGTGCMSSYVAPVEEMMFLLRDVFSAEQQWAELYGDEAPTLDLVEAVLHESSKLATNLLHPSNAPGDRQGCAIKDGVVTTPDAYKEPYQGLAEGGWIGLGADAQYDGQGMPKMVASLVEEMQWAANPALRLYAAATSGVTLVLEDYASEEQRETYLPKMNSGEWTGTMAMTEPHCGTDLGLMRTRAEENEDGSYSLNGSKIFITGGEQDLSDNIVHLVLAKLPGAPAGSRGISLFLVPKRLVNSDGSAGDLNGITCASLEDKMGIKGSTTCVLNFDNTKGWMIGEPNKGLKTMFTMMNYERINVGLQGLGQADVAYQYAVNYAKERRQGRALSGALEPKEVADTLFAHADVRRTLLSQLAYNEAARAFIVYLSGALDSVRYSKDAKTVQKSQALVDLLTPVSKAFITDKGFEGCVNAQQIFGGHGYIKEHGVEQMVRDSRISMLYEGANGVISLDLLARKVVSNGGALVRVFCEDIDECLTDLKETQGNPWLSQAYTSLTEAKDVLLDVTQWCVKQPNLAFNDADEIAAASVEYMHLFGHVAFGFMWAKMLLSLESSPLYSNEAKSNQGFVTRKQQAGRFYFKRLLPNIHSLAHAIKVGSNSVMELPPELF
jgi:alkylation response protein AidB-like acyl-CoA dehydrogenase